MRHNGAILLAANGTPLKKGDKDEIGATGTTLFSGQLSQNEYNADLRGALGIAIYDKMRRSDARVKFALSVCELPLRAATWTVEPASDDQQDVDIAAAIEANLKNMSITWDSYLHHVLLMLPFGFSMFEKVWEVADDGVRLRKLAPRLPQTLYKWNLDDTGGFLGIEQQVFVGLQYKVIPIEAEKMLVFTNDKEGSNFEGVSILRTAYKHWYYKDNLYRIDGIAAERHATGVPLFKHPSTASKEDKDRIDQLGQRLYANESAYVRLGEGYEFDIKGLAGSVRDIMPSIQHHDKKIVESVLADFVDVASGGNAGGWALSKDKSSFFLMSLKSVATNIMDTMNTYLIPQWVNFNYAGVTDYPKMKCSKLDTRDVVALANAVSQLLTSGGLTKDEGIETTMRDLMELPELAKEEAKAVPTTNAPVSDAAPVKQAGVDEAAANIATGEKLNGIQIQAALQVIKSLIYNQVPVNVAVELLVAVGIDRPQVERMVAQAKGVRPKELPEGIDLKEQYRRALTLAEQSVNFGEIDGKLTGAVDAMTRAVAGVQAKQIAKLADLAAKAVAAKDFKKLEDIDVPFRAEMAAAIEGVLADLYTYGRQQVKQELAKQTGAKLAEPWPDPLTEADAALIREFIKTRAKANANVLATKLKSSVTFGALDQIKAGVVDKQSLEAAMTALSDKELQQAAEHSVNEAFNFGRSSEAQAADDIARVQYSALLDDGTCANCEPLDGQEWDYDDPRTELYANGNPNCKGKWRCRCILVYISKAERRNFK